MKQSRVRSRVQVAGSHEFYMAVRVQLAGHPGFKVLGGSITESSELNAAIAQAAPDVLLLDMMTIEPFPSRGFLPLESLISRPRLVAVAVSYEQQLSLIQQHPLAWATLLTQMMMTPLFVRVIEGVATGCTYFTPSPRLAEPFQFTSIELDVLRLMALGFDASNLIRALHRTKDSIYYIQSQIRRKLDVESNQEAIVAAIREGIVAVLTRPDQDRVA